MNFSRSGSGKPVVLVHGLFGNLDNLKSVANALAQFREVICVDVRNHGNSPWSDDMQYENMAKDLIDLLDELQLDQVDLVGHSMGGKIVMTCALLYPERVSAVVAADIAPVTYDPHHDTVLKALVDLDMPSLSKRKDALDQLLAAGVEQGTAQFILKNIDFKTKPVSWKMNVHVLYREYGSITSWPISGKEYHGPILFIKGEHSDYLTKAHRQEVLAQFPKAQVKIITNTTHWLHAEKPAIFNKLVVDFYKKIDKI
jgi:esterase